MQLETAGWIAIVGSALAVVGTVLPWITAGVSAGPIEVSTAITGLDTDPGLVVAIVSVVDVGVAVAVEAAATRSVGTAVGGLVIVLAAGLQFADLGGITGAGIGLYLSVVGGVVVGAAGLAEYRQAS
jgi:hypothetical protein